MKDIDQFFWLFKLRKVSLIGTKHADEFLFFPDKSMAPFPAEINSAAPGEFLGFIEMYLGNSIIPSVKDIETGEIRDFSGKAVMKDLANGKFCGDLPNIFEQTVRPDDISFVVYHLLVSAKYFDSRTNSGDKKVRPAYAFLPEPLQLLLQMLFQCPPDLLIKPRCLSFHLTGDDVDGGCQGGRFLGPKPCLHFSM